MERKNKGYSVSPRLRSLPQSELILDIGSPLATIQKPDFSQTLMTTLFTNYLDM
ncbi:MAG: hypothetical protein V7K48_15120 [Nostoc sp.]|uniref:hypothetical protein n=1 Tax=Nostoc sp. TaxID=1180 RepID=UPI002FF9E7F4